MHEIVALRDVAPNIHELVIDAPDVAAKAQPGQFAVVIPDELGERIPMSLAGWDSEAGTVTIYFLEAGVSTMKLAQHQAGDRIDFMAPLGRPATVKKYGTIFVGGGCYGVGAIYPIVEAMKTAGNQVITAIEARSDFLLYREERLRRHSDMFFRATSDGSVGSRGKVKDVLHELVEQGEIIDQCYFMGCTFMMMVSSQAAAEHDIPSYVYLNPLMVDATGMCGVCRVTVGGETKFACVDGPEFPGNQVDWEELFHRKSQYEPYEREAYRHTCQLRGEDHD